jgi:glycosyltransferase involved in cell wall biosynthesis
MSQLPLVSIVTPCLNAAAFIEQAIESVLRQDYPRIEYIVMDGGSSDGTVAILERYRDRLQFVSAADGGAADAINRGFARSRGTIIAWLNADDTYLPGAVAAAVRHLMAEPETAVVYGEAQWVSDDGAVLARYPTVSPYTASMFSRECGICQPACFMRRDAFETAGMLDGGLQLSFDYDLWIRLSRRHEFLAIREYLAASRMHRANKTLEQRRRMFQESIGLLRRHYSYVPVSWIFCYLRFLMDGRDQFFEPVRPSLPAYLLSLPIGSAYNYRHLLRYWQEWLSSVTWSAFRRSLARLFSRC